MAVLRLKGETLVTSHGQAVLHTLIKTSAFWVGGGGVLCGDRYCGEPLKEFI